MLQEESSFAQSSELNRLLARADSAHELTAPCRLTAEALGFDRYLLAARFPQAGEVPVQVLITNLPSAWLTLYDARHWIKTDPIVARACASVVPFTSDEIDWEANAETRAMRRNGATQGLKYVIAVPLRGPGAEIGVMSLARKLPLPQREHLERLMSRAQILSTRIYQRLVELIGASSLGELLRNDELSSRERQALSLAAMGHTAKAIASQLGIAPRTVVYFLAQAVSKIGAGSLKEAITKVAIRGQLTLADYPDQVQHSIVFIQETPREDFSIRENQVQPYLMTSTAVWQTIRNERAS